MRELQFNCGVAPMYRLLLLSCLLLVSTSCYATSPLSVTLCTERPWISASMLQRVEKLTGITIAVQTAPWLRCVAELKGGRVDGVLHASFKADRLEYSVYPMADDKVDVSKRMSTDTYHLYRLKGSKVDWDGKAFSNLNGRIGAQAGFSIIDFLLSLGVQVDSGTDSAVTNLQKLELGRVAAVALQTREGDSLLKDDFSSIERVDPALVEKPYYLVFSKQFFSDHADIAGKIWTGIARIREATENEKPTRNNR